MTDKITLTHILSDYASKQAVNANYDIIVAAFNNTLSLDGTTPNSMGANLDMNSKRILNLPAPAGNTEPLRKGDAQVYVDAAVAAQEAAEAAQAIAQSSASTAQTAASTATSEALLAIQAYAGVQAIIATATSLSNAASALWQTVLNSLTSFGINSVPFVKKTGNYTALATDVEIECDSTSGGFTVHIPLTLGTTLKRYRVRVFKSAGTAPVVISADGSTPFTWLINVNDSGGGGWFDIEVDGTNIKAFGVA